MGSLFFSIPFKSATPPKAGRGERAVFSQLVDYYDKPAESTGTGRGGGGLLGFPDRRVFYANDTNRTRSCPYGGLTGRALLHTRHTIAPSGRNE